ncbi:MAG TPA: hypothetical protein VKB80_07565 [Kofleriaceae bacterium]|nr:hypothetical protein [Kofleriaceae bacterium]
MSVSAVACSDSGSGSGSDSGPGTEPDAGADASGGAIPAPFDPGQPYEPQVSADGLSAEITNAFFPAPVGATWAYEAQTDEGLDRIEVEVLDGTEDVWGAQVRTVRDTEFIDGEMIEDTRDWFAQDAAGNVWYMGEDTAEYEGGVVVSTEGSWTSGVDGALPGVQMLANPRVGDEYRQEFFEGEAEDYGEVVSLDESVDVPAGSWTGCVKTRDRSVIEPAADEFKYYCTGIGLVLEEEGGDRVELVEVGGL